MGDRGSTTGTDTGLFLFVGSVDHMGTWSSFPGGKAAVKLTTHLHLAPSLITRGAIPALLHTSSRCGTSLSTGQLIKFCYL
jgi:hypothetical protein